jgi:hypothetical protein
MRCDKHEMISKKQGRNRHLKFVKLAHEHGGKAFRPVGSDTSQQHGHAVIISYRAVPAGMSCVLKIETVMEVIR